MSKKIISGEKNTTTVEKTPKHEPKRLKQSKGVSINISARNVLLTLGVIAVIVACILVGYDQLRQKVIITIKDSQNKEQNYDIKNLAYYIYQGEAQGQSMASLYAQIYGEGYDYWNAEMQDDGTTAASTLADSIIADATEDFVLYQQATSEGYTATDDDKKTANEQTTSTVKNMTRKQKLIKGLSKKDIYNAILIQTIGERYKKDKIASLGLDYKKIKKSIKKSDYKQYDFQYYFVSTSTTNADGNTRKLSADEKKELKKKMEELLKTVKTAEDFATIFGNDENGNAVTKNADNIEYKADGQLIEKDGFDQKIDKKIKAMKVDEISDVLEGSEGFYIIKLTDNTSTDSYDSAVKNAVSKKEESAFTTEYQSNIEPNYDVNVIYKNWNKIKIGSYSI